MTTISLDDGAGFVFADVQRLPDAEKEVENVLIQLPPYRFSVPSGLMPAEFENVIARRLHDNACEIVRSFLGMIAVEAEKKSLREPVGIEEVEARQLSANDANMKEISNG